MGLESQFVNGGSEFMGSASYVDQVRVAVVAVRGTSAGTGFFVSPGVIASVSHVTGNGSPLPTVLWQGKPLTVLRVRTASDLDLALVDVAEREHPILQLSTAADIADVFAFGFQYVQRGYSGYPVFGKNLGPARQGAGDILVITDANIQPGLSGSPLVAVDDGRVIGVIVRDNSDGGGYAMPARLLAMLDEQIFVDNEFAAGYFNIDPTLQRYLTDIIALHGRVSLLESDRVLNVDDIFVSLTFGDDSLTGRHLQRSPGGTPLSSITRRAASLDGRRDLGAPQKVFRAREARIQDVLAHRRVVVLGDPGMGKTTLLKHLLVRVARRELHVGLLPIYVPLDELDDGIGAIERYISAAWTDVSDRLIKAVRDGSAFVLCDGLDEVSASDVARLRGELARIASRGSRVIVTCRTVSYTTHALGTEFRIFECVGFSREQQRRFLGRWFRSTSRGNLAYHAIRGNTATAAITRTPLLLALVAAVLERNPQFALPSRRNEIYARSCEVLLERRPTAETRLDIPTQTKERVLKKLCYALFVRGKEVFTYDELLRYLSEAMAQTDDPLVRESTVRDWRDVLVAHDGMITPAGRHAFRFVHLTVQEYYTAREVVDRGWESELPSVMRSPRWEEVIRLTVAQLPPDDVQRILTALCDFQQTGHIDSALLAARCASDAETVEGTYLQELTRYLIGIATDDTIPEPTRDQAVIALGLVASAHRVSEDAVHQGFGPLLEGPGATVALTLRLIEILRLIVSPRSARFAGERLIAMSADDAIDLTSEIDARLAAAFLGLLGDVGAPESWQVAYPYLSVRSSFVQVAAAEALVSLANPALFASISNEIPALAGVKRQLAWYTLLCHSNAETADRVLRDAVQVSDGALMVWWPQYVAEDVSIPSSTVLTAVLLPQKGVDVAIASVLGRAPGLSPSACRKLLRSTNAPLSVLAQALTHAIGAGADVWAEYVHAVFSQPALSGLRKLCISVAAAQRDATRATIVCDTVANSNAVDLFGETFRMISACRLDNKAEWVRALIAGNRLPMRERLLAIESLATLLGDASIPVVADLFNGTLRERVVAYRILGRIGTSVAVESLIQQSAAEQSIPAEAALLEALADAGGAAAGAFLRRCLDEARWPSCWPPLQPPLRRGEQRASDRRKLSAVAGVHLLRDTDAIEELESLVNDQSESPLVTSAAATALEDLRFARELLAHEELKRRAS